MTSARPSDRAADSAGAGIPAPPARSAARSSVVACVAPGSPTTTFAPLSWIWYPASAGVSAGLTGVTQAPRCQAAKSATTSSTPDKYRPPVVVGDVQHRSVRLHSREVAVGRRPLVDDQPVHRHASEYPQEVSDVHRGDLRPGWGRAIRDPTAPAGPPARASGP